MQGIWGVISAAWFPMPLAVCLTDDLILCQITSQNVSDDYAVTFDKQDMNDGRLNKTGNVRA